jgi:hypothetical protein
MRYFDLNTDIDCYTFLEVEDMSHVKETRSALPYVQCHHRSNACVDKMYFVCSVYTHPRERERERARTHTHTHTHKHTKIILKCFEKQEESQL